MPNALITFDDDNITDPLSFSLQIGDIIYYSPLLEVENTSFLKTTTSSIIKLGPVVAILSNPPSILVEYNSDPGNTGFSTVFPPPANSYIMFEKDKRVNSSSLIGYYADVKLLNNSTKKIELFSLGSEVTESSK